jgi:hypothetical protein
MFRRAERIGTGTGHSQRRDSALRSRAEPAFQRARFFALRCKSFVMPPLIPNFQPDVVGGGYSSG